MTPKIALFVEFAKVAQALGHAHRQNLLEHAAQGERTVDALASAAGLSIGNASQHLQLLRRAGLLRSRREGKFVFYRLASDSVLNLLASIRAVAESNVAEVSRIVTDYFSQRDAFEPVSRQQLMERLQRGDVTLLDVRPVDEFALGHISGAVNVPLRELESRLRELDPEQQVVAYCRGAYCVFSYEAVAALRQAGYNVRRLEYGFPEWRAAGLPWEAGLSAA